SFFVFDLTSTVLTTHDCARGNMQNLHGRIGCVYALPARATGARNFNSQILRLQFKIDVFRLWQYRDCGSRCMDAALRLRRGHTLYTMHSAFVAELAKNRFARNTEDRFLKPTKRGRTRFEVLGF